MKVTCLQALGNNFKSLIDLFSRCKRFLSTQGKENARTKIRMHSSRMCTARFNGHLYGGRGGVQEGMCVLGDVCPGGVHPLPNCILGYTRPAQLHAGIHTPLAQLHAGIDTPCPTACLDTHPLPNYHVGMHPLVDRQTPVKTLPSRNYCCGR